ncbi:Mur ligase family protein [Methanobrevibacter sp.]|uniref:Mur ligase family protein n=1 Tax=Methanobrevibacter sp. TaxID=66852 RepID=UPI0025D706DD|nr:Mur ligase family protein [Methanobrevibacter sp.]MBQ2666131.1 UDP-N-acetylmuramyl peptide synthase [Methanobrevibacter sp.]
MVNLLKFNIAKLSGKVVASLAKRGSGSGGTYAGHIFTKIGGYDSIKELASQLKIGSVLITGTNGKTTTTTLLIKLMSNDIQIRQTYENNILNSMVTSLLTQKGDLGIFEYGIRNMTYGIPDTVEKLIKPIGVVYTTISQEHTQVAGVKNPFEDYFKAKKLLSQGMERGTVVTNADDPRTALIGLEKEKDVNVNYYGISTDGIEDIGAETVSCPKCGEKLTYTKHYLNHRGIYSCSCGFKRPEPNVKLINAQFNPDEWILSIEGNLLNYTTSKNVHLDLELHVPPFGFHNIYNTLASITAYATFTPEVENIESTIHQVFDNLDMSFIPPGRFEVVDIGGKFVGLGQGDNGDALKINAMFMNQFVDAPLEFIYTTPEENEEDIFNDHFKVIRSMNPEHVIVVPGRKSIDKAKEYYEIIKQEYGDAEFYPLSYEEMDVRISKLIELARNSEYKYVIMSGCGEEQAMWERIKRGLIDR